MALRTTARRRRLFLFLLPALLVLAGGASAVRWLGAGSGDSMTATVRVSFGSARKPPVDASVLLAEGANVVDALRAAGVRVTTSEEAGAEACCGVGMVHALDGVASDAATRSGWMYSVNGRAPSVGPAATVVRAGDVIEWTYR